jgi:hypothetical protein
MEKRNKKGQFETGNKHGPRQLERAIEANLGNQNAAKLTEPELKAEAYRQYCAWIAEGWSKESFVFKHPSLSLTYKTMERYIREFPTDFPPLHKEMAESQSLHKWEAEGVHMMQGKVDKCQPAIYQMMMRNKFKWDKEEKKEDTLEADVRTLIKRLDELP